MDINKLKAEVKKNIKASDSTKKKLLYTFERTAFKKKLHLGGCVSSNDLKPTHSTFYHWLLKTYKNDMKLEPHYDGPDDFKITAYLLA